MGVLFLRRKLHLTYARVTPECTRMHTNKQANKQTVKYSYVLIEIIKVDLPFLAQNECRELPDAHFR